MGAFAYVIKDERIASTLPEAIQKAIDHIERKETQISLRERVKELNCLYGLAEIVERPEISLDEILQEAVNIVPPAWQYPELTCSKITLSGRKFQTSNFEETPWTISADIKVHGEYSGTFEVGSLEEIPFLEEEHDLLEALAERLGRIVERKEAERRLMEAKERWERSFSGIGVGIFLIDKDYHIIQCNGAFAGLVGEIPENLLGKKCYELVHGLREPPEICITCAAIEKGQSVKGNIFEPFLEKHLAVSSDPVFSPEGELEHSIHVIRDITDIKEAQKALKESEEMYRSFLDTSPDAIIVTDTTGKIVKVSGQTVEMFGYDNVDQLIGKEGVELLAPKDKERATSSIKAEEETGLGKTTEWEIVRKDGSSFTGEIASSLIRDAGGTPSAFVVAVRDITEKKLAEEEITRLSRQVIREREEARKKIAADLHDDVAQTLNALKIDLHLFKKNRDEQKLKSMDGLIKNAITTIRNVSAELTPSLLYHLGLESALKEYTKDFSENTGIIVGLDASDIPDDIPDDIEISIFRVVQEALTNVNKHSEAIKAKVLLIYENGYLFLSVEDNGEGFNVENLRNGHSLGILGMRERIRMVGGELEFSSEPGEGTIVKAEVPLIMPRRTPFE